MPLLSPNQQILAFKSSSVYLILANQFIDQLPPFKALQDDHRANSSDSDPYSWYDVLCLQTDDEMIVVYLAWISEDDAECFLIGGRDSPFFAQFESLISGLIEYESITLERQIKASREKHPHLKLVESKSAPTEEQEPQQNSSPNEEKEGTPDGPAEVNG